MGSDDVRGVPLPFGVSLVFVNASGYYYVSVEPSVVKESEPLGKAAELYLVPALAHLRQQTEQLRGAK